MQNFTMLCCLLLINLQNVILKTDAYLSTASNFSGSRMIIQETNDAKKVKRSVYNIQIFQHASGPYVTKGSIGTTENSFFFLADTGSSLTWVPSQLLSSDEQYIPKTYASANPVFTFSGNYKLSVISGEIVRNTILFGDVCVHDYQVVVVHNINPRPVLLGAYEGVLGLDPTSTFVTWIRFAQPSNARFFTLWFPLNRIPGYGSAEMEIGRLDDTHRRTPLRTFQTTSQTRWSIMVDRILLGNIPLCSANCEIVIDTGVTIGSGPREQLMNAAPIFGALSQLPDETFIVDCNTIDEKPGIYIYAGNDAIDWKMRDACVKATSYDYQRCYFGFRPNSDVYSSTWTFGILMMRKLYTVFNAESMTIDIALANFPQ